jgi:DNA segregation ATPase FtsK/SpoIIIE-like protein
VPLLRNLGILPSGIHGGERRGAEVGGHLSEPRRSCFAGNVCPGSIASTPKPADRKRGAVAERVVNSFKAFGLSVEASDVVEGPQVTRVKVRPAAGVKVASLANRADDLQVSLALDAPPLIRPGRGFVVIDLPRANRQTILLLEALERGVMKASKSPMAFPVGVGIEGEAILTDFCDSNTCHILVAGTSGSGKSEWLKTLVASLVRWNPPEHLRLALVDPKVLTFSSIADSAYLWRPVAIDLGSALGILRDAISEMDRRYRMLAKEGLVSLHDRFQEGRTDVPFLILVFDEFADLDLDRTQRKEGIRRDGRSIGQKGRAAGIHLVLATQRPDRTVVTGLIKSNLPMKVCLRVANATNSQIVLGEPGAESLLGKGDLLCDLGRGPVRAQSYFIHRRILSERLVDRAQRRNDLRHAFKSRRQSSPNVLLALAIIGYSHFRPK